MKRLFDFKMERYVPYVDRGLICRTPSVTSVDGYRSNKEVIESMLRAGANLEAFRAGRMAYDEHDEDDSFEVVPVYNDKLGWLAGLKMKVSDFFRRRFDNDGKKSTSEKDESKQAKSPADPPPASEKNKDSEKSEKIENSVKSE